MMKVTIEEVPENIDKLVDLAMKEPIELSDIELIKLKEWISNKVVSIHKYHNEYADELWL